MSVQFDEAAHTFAALRAADLARQEAAGTVYWSKRNGIEYLLRADARRKVETLGARSAKMEAVHAALIGARQYARDRHKQLAGNLKQQQKLNRVLRVGHVPTAWVRILNGIWRAGMEEQVTVVGAAATYAYECAGRVRIVRAARSVEDAAVLAERCSRLQLKVSDAGAAQRMLEVIQQAVPSFQTYRDQRYLAIDPRGLEVSVQHDAAAAPQRSQMLLCGPAFVQSVAAVNGEMASMRTLAPRAFVLDRLMRSKQAERDGLERRRDASLAQLVMAITLERLEGSNLRHYMPQLAETKGQLWSADSMNISA
ncbi:MAG: hypothetical protein JO002_00785 [Burkholderiaceae bacterium]|nr:hypothetical protein [Burkholderiaceae bacterium]